MKIGTSINVEADKAAKEVILKPITREYNQNLRGEFKMRSPSEVAIG